MMQKRKRPYIIGITGNIGAGKSTVVADLKRLGAGVVDADQLSRQAVEPGTAAHQALYDAFGSVYFHPDGRLDRGKLAERVFQDEASRKRLEDIVHPAIARLAQEAFEKLSGAGIAVVLYDAPLLIEAGQSELADEVWLVEAAEQTRLSRVMRRDGGDEADVRLRMAAQMPQQEKRALAQVVIDNNGDLQYTIQQARQYYRLAQQRSQR